MKNPLKYSPEGLPWKDYRLLQFLAAAPISYALGLGLEIMARVSKKSAVLIGAETLPHNAIIYGFHVDVCLNYITMHLLRDIGYKVIFTTSHDFDSYLASGPGSFGAYESWRFDRRFAVKPLDQIIAMLHKRPEAVLGIFTDGARGRPYRVRESLVKLAIASQRPLVPYRSLYSPTVRLMGDDFPLGFWVRGKSVFGSPISPSTLQSMGEERDRDYLEKALLSIDSPGLEKERPLKK